MLQVKYNGCQIDLKQVHVKNKYIKISVYRI